MIAALAVALSFLSAPAAFAIEPNGTFIKIPSTSPVYEVIGGAAIRVYSCKYLGNCPNIVYVTSLSGYATTPVNGTLIKIADGPNKGWVGEAVGGAFLHVDKCPPVHDCSGDITLDSGGANAYLTAHPVPTNGSFVRIADGPSEGWVGEIIGGALIHVDKGGCAILGCAGDVSLDSGGVADYRSVHPTPADGTFILVADGPLAGTMSRAAGGALLPITDCSALGGCAGYVTLDSGGTADYVAAHPAPADGSYLLGLPSNQTWEVLGGQRQPVTANPAAVAVNDASLNGIPVVPPQTGTQTPPPPKQTKRAHHHKKQVRVKLTLKWRWNKRRTQLERMALGRLPHHARVHVTCTGGGCPHHVLTASAHGVRHVIAILEGSLFAAGDRIEIVIGAPRRTPERVQISIRDGRIPRVKLLA